MKTISLIVGTRPEAIKLAPIALALRDAPQLRCRICATAQHREMLDQVLDAFGLSLDADLDLMSPGQSLATLSARAIEGLDRYLADDRPDLVLVQGDTTTVFCATLSAFYRQIPVGHVEAGLRTGNLMSPWPEEANRVLTSRLASLHFAPTAGARDNLLREGTRADQIFVTGNTGIDALIHMRDQKPTALPIPLHADQKLVLITAHRRESFGEPFERICGAIRALAEGFPEVAFVYPVHPNPNVMRAVNTILRPAGLKNVHLLAPLAYPEFVALMMRASVILTDSGGIQEEAPSLGKPVLVLRDTTERPEAVEAGTVRLVGTDREQIVRQCGVLLTHASEYQRMSRAHNPYGDGHAAKRIIDACEEFLNAAVNGQVSE